MRHGTCAGLVFCGSFPRCSFDSRRSRPPAVLLPCECGVSFVTFHYPVSRLTGRCLPRGGDSRAIFFSVFHGPDRRPPFPASSLSRRSMSSPFYLRTRPDLRRLPVRVFPCRFDNWQRPESSFPCLAFSRLWETSFCSVSSVERP